MIGYSIETPIISIFYVWVFGHITTYGQTDRLTMFSYTHSDVVTDSHKSFSNVSCGCESWTGLLCLSIRWRTGRFVGEPAWRRCTSAPTVSAWCRIVVAGVCTDKCEAHEGHDEMRTPRGRPPTELWQLNCDNWQLNCEKSGTETCVPEALALVAKCWLARVMHDVLCHRFEHVDMLPWFSCGAPSLARVVEWIIARPGESQNWRRTMGDCLLFVILTANAVCGVVTDCMCASLISCNRMYI